MSLTLETLLFFVPPLLLIQGFFSGSEIALLSADKIRLKSNLKKGSHRSKLALELALHPERVLSTTLLMTSLCVIGTSTLVALFFVHHDHGEFFAVLCTSPIIVILGELIPKTVYQKHADKIAPWVALPIHFTYWFFLPITHLLSGYTSRVSRLMGPLEELVTGKRKNTREELIAILGAGKKETDIKSSEKRMIRRIFDFKDTEAKHALIPLVKVDAIEDSAMIRDALEKFKDHRHSRMPVYSGRIDNIVGVIELADLGSAVNPNYSIHGYITPAHYVAETQALKDLLFDMNQEDNEMVVVVDEYGGAVGILTFEDIVEEIVGEISDEYDHESLPYKELGEDRWLVQSRMEIQLIGEQLKIALPEGDYETLAGFLLQQFGRIPEVGDELFFDTATGSLKFTVRKASERQIESVLIEKI